MKPSTRTTISIVLACLLTLAMTTAFAAPAAAEHDGGESGGVSDMLTPSDDGILATVFGSVAGLTDRALYKINGPDDTATENRDQAVQTFNQYNDSFVAYANNRSIHEDDVVQVDCVIEGETATAYIVADYNDSLGKYESAKAVTSTSRTVDHTVTLEANACDNAAEEIETFHDKFASTDKDVTRKYLAEMASKYGSNVDEPFTGGN